MTIFTAQYHVISLDQVIIYIPDMILYVGISAIFSRHKRHPPPVKLCQNSVKIVSKLWVSAASIFCDIVSFGHFLGSLDPIYDAFPDPDSGSFQAVFRQFITGGVHGFNATLG